MAFEVSITQDLAFLSGAKCTTTFTVDVRMEEGCYDER